MIGIGIIDGHDLFRQSLTSLIQSFPNVKVVTDLASIKEYQVQKNKTKVDLILMDVGKINESVTRNIAQLRHQDPTLRLIILSNDLTADSVLKLIQSGANGFYSKEVSRIVLEKAILEIFKNHSPCDVKFGPKIREKLLQDETFLRNLASRTNVELSRRELQILELICMEKSNIEISSYLHLSVRTIESHRRKIIEKTNSKNMIGAIIFAIQQNLLPKSPPSILEWKSLEVDGALFG